MGIGGTRIYDVVRSLPESSSKAFSHVTKTGSVSLMPLRYKKRNLIRFLCRLNPTSLWKARLLFFLQERRVTPDNSDQSFFFAPGLNKNLLFRINTHPIAKSCKNTFSSREVYWKMYRPVVVLLPAYVLICFGVWKRGNAKMSFSDSADRSHRFFGGGGPQNVLLSLPSLSLSQRDRLPFCLSVSRLATSNTVGFICGIGIWDRGQRATQH